MDNASRYGRDLRGLLLGLAFGGAACAATPTGDAPALDGNSACTPGTRLACMCRDGAFGITTCDARGQGSRTCACREPQPPDSGSAPKPRASNAGDAGPRTSADSATQSASARNVRIARVAIYQAVEVTLMQAGEAVVERNAPVVVGKAAMLRVFVEPLSNFVPRELITALDLVSSDGKVRSLESHQRVDIASTDVALNTTFNLDLPAADVTSEVRYALSLQEVSTAATQPGVIDPRARWPQGIGSLASLGARDAGPLRIMLVPYRYLADGSGRLPTTDDAELQGYLERLSVLFPASELLLEVHEPVEYDAEVTPEKGWNEWLDLHCALRASEHPDPKLVYYGTIAPTESWATYGAGIVGISNVPGPGSNYGRCSVGIGFAGAQSTMAHELGHALGLPHAPCGTPGGPFPYADGKIGVWGLALPTHTLKDPSIYYDLMSYCEPAFISDFNFERLFERIRYLNLEFDRAPAARRQYYLRLLVAEDGSTAMRGRSMLDEPPGGPEEMREVSLLDDSGQVTAQAHAYFLPSSNAPAGVWLIPDTGAAAIRAAGLGTIELR